MVQGLSRKKENKTSTSAVLISALQIIYFFDVPNCTRYQIAHIPLFHIHCCETLGNSHQSLYPLNITHPRAEMDAQSLSLNHKLPELKIQAVLVRVGRP